MKRSAKRREEEKMTDKTKKFVSVGLATIATSVLVPVVEAGTRTLSRKISSFFSDPDPDDEENEEEYEMDPDEEDFEDEDDDEPEPPKPSSSPKSPKTEKEREVDVESLIGDIATFCEHLSEETRIQLLKAICGNSIDFTVSAESTSSEKEEAATSEEEELEPEEESIYIEKVGLYDSLLQEKEFVGIEKKYPQIYDIIRECEEKNLSIDGARTFLRASLRKLKLEEYSKKHPKMK